MQLDLSGKHALVCGASQGIGRAIAIELAALGAQITALARSADKLDALVAELPGGSERKHGRLVVDMSDSGALRADVARLVAANPAHIVINNTGGPPGGSAHEAEPQAYLDAYNQHLIAAQTLLQCVLPGMRKARWGRWINVISTSVKEPIAGLGVSNTTRAAMAGWAKTVSTEIAADGITVNNVLPGFTKTARLDGLITARAKASGNSEQAVAEAMKAGVPAARFGEVEEIAAVAAFLCTPAAAYVNGVSIAVDGGRTRALS
ncbi:MAG TPA: SDR family oxidoreductase [Oleiagrimonas sp.]|nr:SDR family oxidoreductase [Oleiagrimonas sp.]